jgi:hypothetical protein
MQKLLLFILPIILIAWCSDKKTDYQEIVYNDSTNVRQISCSYNRRDYKFYSTWYCDRYYNSPMDDTEMICIKYIWQADKTIMDMNNRNDIKTEIVWEEDDYLRCEKPFEEIDEYTKSLITWCN